MAGTHQGAGHSAAHRKGVYPVVFESFTVRAVRIAREVKATPAPRRRIAPRMRYHLPSAVSAELTPLREKTTAPSDQMSVSRLVLFMPPA
jgi:hypothetical protein